MFSALLWYFLAMKRRDLLKALSAVALSPFFLNGKEAGAHTNFAADRKCILFINTTVIPIPDKFAESIRGKLPEGTIVIPLAVPPGQTFADAIRIYQ